MCFLGTARLLWQVSSPQLEDHPASTPSIRGHRASQEGFTSLGSSAHGPVPCTLPKACGKRAHNLIVLTTEANTAYFQLKW